MPSTRNVCVTSPFFPITAFRSSSGRTRRAVGVGEQRVVPLRQEAHRSRRVGRRQRRARQVEQLAARSRPGSGAAARARRSRAATSATRRPDQSARSARVDGPEGGEVAADELGARGEHRPSARARGAGGRRRAARPSRAPTRARAADARVAGRRGRSAAARCSSVVPVLALEVREPVLVRERRLSASLRAPCARLQGVREVRVVVPRRHVAQRPPEHRVVARGDEMQRPAHHGRLHHLAAQDRALERIAREARHARPEPDVRRRRPLRLHPGEPLDRWQHADALALEQQLPRERRAVQLPQRQDSFGHAHAASELDRAAGDDRVLRELGRRDLPTAPGLTKSAPST